MQEKLGILKVLDEEIINIIDEANVEIEQRDICREDLQLALENIEAVHTPSIPGSPQHF